MHAHPNDPIFYSQYALHKIYVSQLSIIDTVNENQFVTIKIGYINSISGKNLQD